MIDHFLGLVPNGFKLKFFKIWKLLLPKKYSNELCVRLVQRFEPVSRVQWPDFSEFMPDLAKHLCLS